MFGWMINCKAVTQIASEAMDRPLPLHKRLWMRIHRILCRHCVEVGNQMQLMRRAAAAEPPPSEDSGKKLPCLSEEAKTRLKHTLFEKCRSGSGSEASVKGR